MPRTYVARYTLLAFIISSVFVVSYATLELIEHSRLFPGSAVLPAIGLDDCLVLIAPLTFIALAWAAGRQRDRAAALGREREALNEMLRTLLHASDLDLDQTLVQVTQQLMATAQADAAGVLLLEHDQWRTYAAAQADALLSFVRAQAWPPARRAVFEPAGESGVWLTVIESEGEPIGWLVVRASQAPAGQQHFGDLLTTIADHIGSAVTRSRQYTALRRRARDLEAIAEINHTLLAGMQLDALLEVVVNSAQVRFGLPLVAVWWVDEPAGEFYLRAKAGPLAHLMPEHYRQKLTQGTVAQVYRTGRPYLAAEESAESMFGDAAAPIKSSFLAPMTVGDKVIAVLSFDSREPRAFSAEDVAVLTTLADQAAIAAENARLISEALREHRRVTAILHSTRDVVILIDREDRVQLLNPAAERLVGVTTVEAAGLPIDLLFNLRPIVEAARQADQNESEAQSFEIAFGPTTYLVTITLARDETGGVFGRVLMMKDITHLKQLDQFKSQMIQMTSHDLRTPLGVASGYVELLSEEQQLTPEAKEFVEGVKGALLRMETLITELLDVERVEAGVDLIRQIVDLNRLVADVVPDYAGEARASQQTLEWTPAADALPVLGDALRLKQVLGNIIGNAIKYTPAGGHIAVRLFRDNQHVVIEVQDTGYGIPEEAQPKVFQRFFRVRAPGTEHVAGTGLGLSLVKAVLDQHGGTIALRSQPGEGSTFTVQLPIATADRDGGLPQS